MSYFDSLTKAMGKTKLAVSQEAVKTANDIAILKAQVEQKRASLQAQVANNQAGIVHQYNNQTFANRAGIGGTFTYAPPEVVDPNNIPAYNTPIETIKGLWAAKFGDTWVDVQKLDLQGDSNFYVHAYNRLTQYRMFEVFESRFVKLKEGA